MNDLKLIPTDNRLSTGVWSPEDYNVVDSETGQTIGRILLRTPFKTSWFWQLDSFHAIRGKPYFGQADTKDAAERAIRESLARIRATSD